MLDLLPNHERQQHAMQCSHRVLLHGHESIYDRRLRIGAAVESTSATTADGGFLIGVHLQSNMTAVLICGLEEIAPKRRLLIHVAVPSPVFTMRLTAASRNLDFSSALHVSPDRIFG